MDRPAAGERGGSGEVYHVGREDEVAIGALIERIGAVLGVELTLVPGERPAGGTPRRCPAIGKLRGLGYAPAIDLDAGLAETVAWYRDACLKAR